MKIKQKFDFVEGELDTDMEMVCVVSKKYTDVELCLKDGYNFPIAKIKLYSRDRYIDALEVFESAQTLGREICARWNKEREKK